ncbi:hypothetical protein H7I41_06640 [Mycobacterium manitobense]|uniref:Outer membrane protein n=1 Tax=[Mycobacterium] manitobense TaxID=190147 RepID=A0A9X2Y7W9_9MYCO|nr:hypothetical protein [[Mycobacterium] manitobense]MCV7169597.1 hypothetical protein [[Mycobacterium] manitobense]
MSCDIEEAAPAVNDAEAAEAENIQPSGRRWRGVILVVVLPVVALLLAVGGGYLKWIDSTNRAAEHARQEAVSAASDSTVAMLSYRAATAESELMAAESRLTGAFRESYRSLIRDVVIPGAVQQNIAAAAEVVAAAPVSATADRAVVVVFVNQKVTVADDPPTDTTSSVRVTLDKVGDRWLISEFEPI